MSLAEVILAKLDVDTNKSPKLSHNCSTSLVNVVREHVASC